MSGLKKKIAALAARVDALEAELQQKDDQKDDGKAAEEEDVDDDDAAPRQEKSEVSRVIYLGHVPHGFYEGQMESFFGQFGTVTKVRLSRSKRTGGSKGYAFVEFADAGVAAIAAKAMDRYLIGGKQLVAHVVPLDLARRSDLFEGRRVLKPKPKRDRPEANLANLAAKVQAKRQRINEKLGFDYDYDGYPSVSLETLPDQDATTTTAKPSPSKKKKKMDKVVDDTKEEKKKKKLKKKKKKKTAAALT